jgi:hypothetical protein
MRLLAAAVARAGWSVSDAEQLGQAAPVEPDYDLAPDDQDWDCELPGQPHQLLTALGVGCDVDVTERDSL